MRRKRGNSEESIYQRKDDRWVGVCFVHTAKGLEYRNSNGNTHQAVAEKLTKAAKP